MSIYTKRLNDLANLLETYPLGEHTQFDMSAWGRIRWQASVSDAANGTLKHECGTAFCAVGLACYSNLFEGLGYSWDEEGTLMPFIVRDGIRIESWPAVQAFFGLDDAQVAFAFDMGTYYTDPTPREVAQRLRGLALHLEEAAKAKRQLQVVALFDQAAKEGHAVRELVDAD